MALWERAQYSPTLRDRLFHIPNGGKRNPVEAARMKRMGVRKGVHDYFLPVARGPYHGLWVELKPDIKPKARATTEQREWREAMREEGYAAVIVVGWEAAIEVMLAYLTLEPNMFLEPSERGRFIGDYE